jgi:hypothetical protein
MTNRAEFLFFLLATVAALVLPALPALQELRAADDAVEQATAPAPAHARAPHTAARRSG